MEIRVALAILNKLGKDESRPLIVQAVDAVKKEIKKQKEQKEDEWTPCTPETNPKIFWMPLPKPCTRRRSK